MACEKLIEGFDPKHGIRCSGPAGHEGPCTNNPCVWRCKPAHACLMLGNGCSWQKGWAKDDQ